MSLPAAAVVAVVVVLTTVVVVLGVGLLVGHVLVGHGRAARLRVTDDIRQQLVGVILGREDPATTGAVLRRRPPQLVDELLVGTARRVTGTERARLQRVAEHAGAHDRARAALSSRHWWERLEATRLLGMTGGASPVLAVLDDPHPEVRAAAAIWTGRQAVDAPEVASVLAERLLDASGLVRAAARFACTANRDSGSRAVQLALERVAASPDQHHVLSPIAPLRVSAEMPTSEHLDLIRHFARSPHPRVCAAALDAWGAIGDPEALREAVELLRPTQPAAVRIAAVHVVATSLPSLRELVPLITDDDWRVRQAVREGLRAVGAPGQVLLRRALRHDERLAPARSEVVV